MAFNGSGVFNRIYNWVTDAANLIDITASRMDAEMDGMADGLSNCVTKDGQTAATANLPMGGYRHTGVGNSSARTHYAATGQVQDSGFLWCAVGGTVDAITLTPTPAITAYAAGQTFRFVSAGANTGAVTVAVSGLAAKDITQQGATALNAGDIKSGAVVTVTYDGTQFQAIISNPSTASETVSGISELATDAETLSSVSNRVTTPANITARLASPPAIGGTAPGAGTFTDLTLTKTLLEKKGADVASATTLTLGDGNSFIITGTTTTTSFATKGVGFRGRLRAAGAWPITHDGDYITIQGNASYTCKAGDIIDVWEHTAGKVYLTIPTYSVYVKVSDQKSTGTAGGSFNAAAWRTRTINTEDSDTHGVASISSNQITLAAGTYDCLISCPGNQCGVHRARLYDITGGAVLLAGGNVASSASVSVCVRSFVSGRFTIATASALEVQHYGTTSQATDGFGLAVSSGENEVYTVAEFWRVS